MKVSKEVASKIFLQGREVKITDNFTEDSLYWKSGICESLEQVLELYYKNSDDLTFEVQGNANTKGVWPHK